jgi:hypothetical protein
MSTMLHLMFICTLASAQYIDDKPDWNRPLMIMGRPYHGFRPYPDTREVNPENIQLHEFGDRLSDSRKSRSNERGAYRQQCYSAD